MVTRIAFLVGLVATAVGPFLGPLCVRRLAMPSDGSVLAAGPTPLGTWLQILPWLVALTYLIASTVVFSWPYRMPGRAKLGFVELAQRLSAGRAGHVTAVVLIAGSLAVWYGVSAYWFVTADELAIHRGWGAATATHPWSEVTKRFIGCGPRKLDYVLMFKVTAADGSSVDLANAPQAEFARHFFELLHLTDNAATELGAIEHCSAAYRDTLKYIFSAR
jgi:hypothetical protein